MEVLPVPNPRLELNAEQMRESEYRCTLALRIRVDRLRLYMARRDKLAKKGAKRF